MFAVFCDESGKLQDKKWLTFVGVVASPEDEYSLAKQWVVALRQAGLDHLHMAKAMSPEGPFQGRTEERDATLERLGTLIRDIVPCHFVLDMDNQKFLSLPQVEQERLKNPLYCAFEGLLRALADNPETREADRFQLIYDLSEEYCKECLKLFNRMRKDRPQCRKFFPMLSFADDEQIPGLQAADMIAYCRRQEALAGGIEKCSGIVRKLLDLFGQGGVTANGAIVYRHGSELDGGRLEQHDG